MHNILFIYLFILEDCEDLVNDYLNTINRKYFSLIYYCFMKFINY